MNYLSKDDIARIQLAKADYAGAASEFVSVCRMTFKRDTKIYWKKNNHIQYGTVISWNGTAAYPTIRVESNRTGKVYDISVNDIDWEYMQDEAKS